MPSGRTVWLAKAALTGGLIAVLAWRLDISSLGKALDRLSATGFIASTGLFMLCWGIAALKWKVLLPSRSWIELFRLNLIAQYYSILLPGQIAGEAVKAWRLGRGKPDAERVAVSVAIDRITGLIGLLLVAWGGLVASPRPFDFRAAGLLCLAGAAGVILLAGLGMPWVRRPLLALVRRVAKARPRFCRIAGQIEGCVDAWRAYLGKPGALLASVALGGLFQLVAVLINQRFGSELGLNIGFADWCWVFGVVSLITVIPVTIGGLGLREGSFVAVLALLGVSAEDAMAQALAMLALLLLGALVGGIIDWLGPGPMPAGLKGDEA